MGTDTRRTWCGARQEASHRRSGPEAGSSPPPPLGYWRGVPTIASDDLGGCIGCLDRIVDTPSSVTASCGFGNSHPTGMKSEAAEQVAAPAEPSNTQLAPGINRPIEECGWKGGDSSCSATQVHVMIWTNETLRRKYRVEANT